MNHALRPLSITADIEIRLVSLFDPFDFPLQDKLVDAREIPSGEIILEAAHQEGMVDTIEHDA